MMRKLLATILLTSAALMGLSQARIGFTNLDGFPSLVMPAQSYNLSGWLHNSGNDTLSGNLSIRFKTPLTPNNGHSIENSFALSNPLPPGDSIFWSKSGYTFPNGLLAPGHNDVLIWPTRTTPGDSIEVDTLEKVIYYADASAFAVLPQGLESWTQQGLNLEATYDLDLRILNVGNNHNDQAVEVSLFIDNLPPVVLALSPDKVSASDTLTVSVQGLSVITYIKAAMGNVPNGHTAQVKISAKEVNGLPPYKTQDFVSLPYVSPVATEEELASATVGAYPNPSTGWVALSLPPAVRELNLFDATGRQLATLSPTASRIDLGSYPQGIYLLQAKTAQGKVLNQRIIKH